VYRGESHRRAHDDGTAGHPHGCGERLGQPHARRVRVAPVRVGAAEQGRELVAAEPGDQIVAGVGGQPPRRRDEHLVAGGAAERVVDQPQVVQIEEDADQRWLLGVGEPRGALVLEGGTVGQAGQRVVARGVPLELEFSAQLRRLHRSLSGEVPGTQPRADTGCRGGAGGDGQGQRVHAVPSRDESWGYVPFSVHVSAH
jgi:hypothetical protein